MAESRVEIGRDGGDVEIPDEICCNCASADRVVPVPSELKLTRFIGLGGSEYTFRWRLPFCTACRHTAERTPINVLHVVLVAGALTAGLFLMAVGAQIALDRSLFGGSDLWLALGLSVLIVCALYGSRRPSGAQTSYYQPVRIRKLRQKFTSGEVTGIVIGFTNATYMQRFRERNATALRA
ncbi:MAG: hypothetical protein QNK04_03815 [Myxococcota bacterium]|nr:hypothetical protein [Myxococcota bacterium]